MHSATFDEVHVAALRALVRAGAEDRPGVYRMIGPDGGVIYVGKSKRVRTRLLSYFRGSYPTDKGARIVREAYDDPFQFDAKSEYYDPKSKKESPSWSAVDVAFVEKLPKPVSLDTMREDPALEGMRVTQKGSRLSVTPVDSEHFRRVLTLGGSKRTR